MLGCMIVRRMKVRESINEQEVRHGEGDYKITSQINSTMTLNALNYKKRNVLTSTDSPRTGCTLCYPVQQVAATD
jgi:hypothetical protein